MIQWFIDRRWGWHRVGLSSRYFSGDITHARLLQPRMRSLKRSEMCSTQILRPIPSARSTPRFFAPSFDDLFDVNTVNMYFFCPVTGFATSPEMPMRSVVTQLRKRPESQASDSILWRPGCGSAVPYVAGCQTSESQWNMVKVRPDQANLCNQLNHMQFGSRNHLCFSGKRCVVVFFYVEANKDFQVKYRSGE